MKKLFIGIITLLSCVACDDPNEGDLFVQPTTIEAEMSMTTILEKSPETYSLWVDLLKHANFYNALKDANAKATVFCPNNQAIEQFLKERGVSSVTELDQEYARRLVQNHIIDWQNSSNTLSDSTLIDIARKNGNIEAQNLFNKYLTLSFGYVETDVDDADRSDMRLSPDSIFFNNQAKLGRFVSTTCANGVIYMMDDVIIPNAENIVEKLELLSGNNNSFKIFAEAIKADPEMYRMATLERDTMIAEGGVHVVNTYSYTCFAVPDFVMEKNNVKNVDDLKRWLVDNSNGEETNPDSALNHYLKYHFMSTQHTISDLFNATDPTETLIYDTQYEGQAFIANIFGGQRTLNQTIPVLRSDIEASNGLINKVGGMMPVYHPTPVNVKWDFLNSADIIGWVNGWSTENKQGNIFSSALASTARQIDLSEEHYDGEHGKITSFTAKFNDSKASSKNYRRVGFMKEKYKSAKEKETPEHGAFMNNYLVLNLGFAGWVEFKTPTIIAGRYKVVLHYIKDPAQQKLFTSGTLVQFNIDSDQQTLAYLYKGLPTMPLFDSAEETLWGEMTFDKSETHTFKITTRDIQAKTESYYHLRLDYVEFIPLD